MLYVDIPTQQDIKALNKRRADACVSMYVPTTPLTQDVGISRTELRKLSKQAFNQLERAGFDKRRLALMQEAIDHLLDDDEFWRLQANSLAVLLTPEDIRTDIPACQQAAGECGSLRSVSSQAVAARCCLSSYSLCAGHLGKCGSVGGGSG